MTNKNKPHRACFFVETEIYNFINNRKSLLYIVAILYST